MSNAVGLPSKHQNIKIYTQNHTQRLKKIILYFKLIFIEISNWFANYPKPNPNPSFFLGRNF